MQTTPRGVVYNNFASPAHTMHAGEMSSLVHETLDRSLCVNSRSMSFISLRVCVSAHSRRPDPRLLTDLVQVIGGSGFRNYLSEWPQPGKK